MSIKPIDFHLTHANTVNEAKNKQVDIHRVRDNHEYLQQQQEAEVKRKQERIIHSEETLQKKIGQDQRRNQGGGPEQQKQKRQPDGKKEKTEAQANLDRTRGTRFDMKI